MSAIRRDKIVSFIKHVEKLKECAVILNPNVVNELQIILDYLNGMLSDLNGTAVRKSTIVKIISLIEERKENTIETNPLIAYEIQSLIYQMNESFHIDNIDDHMPPSITNTLLALKKLGMSEDYAWFSQWVKDRRGKSYAGCNSTLVARFGYEFCEKNLGVTSHLVKSKE